MNIGSLSSSLLSNSLNHTQLDSQKAKASQDSFEKQLESAMDKKDEALLKKACQDFEGMILNMMFKQMKASIPKSDLIPQSMGKDIFDSMLDEKLMEEASQSHGIGLADALYRQLDKRLKSTYKPSNTGGNTPIAQKE